MFAFYQSIGLCRGSPTEPLAFVVYNSLVAVSTDIVASPTPQGAVSADPGGA